MKLEYRLDEGSIHHVRLMVHSFVLLTTKDRSVAGRLTVTCAELVEDATGCASAQLSCEVSAAHYAQLAQVVREVNTGTPLEAYSRALSRAAQRSENSLSLARVRYEGLMTLSLRQVGARINLIASATR